MFSSDLCGWTCAHYAAQNAHDDCLRVMHEHSISLMERTDGGDLPVQVAAEHGTSVPVQCAVLPGSTLRSCIVTRNRLHRVTPSRRKYSPDRRGGTSPVLGLLAVPAYGCFHLTSPAGDMDHLLL